MLPLLSGLVVRSPGDRDRTGAVPCAAWHADQRVVVDRELMARLEFGPPQTTRAQHAPVGEQGLELVPQNPPRTRGEQEPLNASQLGVPRERIVEVQVAV